MTEPHAVQTAKAETLMRLSDALIRSLKPTGKQYQVRDDTLAGFGVRVSQQGTRTFVLMHGSDRRLTTIGRCNIITLQNARLSAVSNGETG